jgi:hypothetical protein
VADLWKNSALNQKVEVQKDDGFFQGHQKVGAAIHPKIRQKK